MPHPVQNVAPPPSLAWCVTDGRAGNENPCLGLIAALGLPAVVQRVDLVAPWRWLPPPLTGSVPADAALSLVGGGRLVPPWPTLLVASGRRSIAAARAVRRASRGATFTVYIQDPRCNPRAFDLVLAPEHDRLTGANVIATRGGLNAVTPERLTEAAHLWEPRLAYLPAPRVMVSLGGPGGGYRFRRVDAQALGHQLAEAVRAVGGSILFTASRRTPPELAEAMTRALGGLPAFLWDGRGENPYFGFLALADAIVATADSVNMLSEACSTGRPVHVFALPGGKPKFHAFHASLMTGGLTRPFTGRIEAWSYAPLDETRRVARLIAEQLAMVRSDGRLTRPPASQ